MLQTKRVLESEQVCSKRSSESQHQIGINFMLIGFQLSPLERRNVYPKRPRNCTWKSFESQEKKTTSDRVTQTRSSQEEEMRVLKWCFNCKNRFQWAYFFSFWSQTACREIRKGEYSSTIGQKQGGDVHCMHWDTVRWMTSTFIDSFRPGYSCGWQKNRVMREKHHCKNGLLSA